MARGLLYITMGLLLGGFSSLGLPLSQTATAAPLASELTKIRVFSPEINIYPYDPWQRSWHEINNYLFWKSEIGVSFGYSWPKHELLSSSFPARYLLADPKSLHVDNEYDYRISLSGHIILEMSQYLVPHATVGISWQHSGYQVEHEYHHTNTGAYGSIQNDNLLVYNRDSVELGETVVIFKDYLTQPFEYRNIFFTLGSGISPSFDEKWYPLAGLTVSFLLDLGLCSAKRELTSRLHQVTVPTPSRVVVYLGKKTTDWNFCMQNGILFELDFLSNVLGPANLGVSYHSHLLDSFDGFGIETVSNYTYAWLNLNF